MKRALPFCFGRFRVEVPSAMRKGRRSQMACLSITPLRKSSSLRLRIVGTVYEELVFAVTTMASYVTVHAVGTILVLFWVDRDTR